MDILTVAEVQAIVNSSKIQNKYNQVIDSESAYELLTAKLNESESRNQQEQEAKESNKSTKKEETWMDNPAVKQATRTAASILTRSLLGVLGLGGTTRRRKNSLF
jgi:hypothetical protein